jgi:predicted nucleotidyltransferase
MLFRPLDQALGSIAKVRVLRALMTLGSPASGNELRELARIRSKSGHKIALDQLVALGIVERDETRRVHFYRLNRDHDLAHPLAALFEAESRRISALRQALQDILDRGAVRERTLSIILFGSNARGDARPTSDADLFVVAADEPSALRVREVLVDATSDLQHRFGLRISPLVLARERIQERYRDGDPLMKNIENEGRTLYGTHFQEVVGLW